MPRKEKEKTFNEENEWTITLDEHIPSIAIVVNNLTSDLRNDLTWLSFNNMFL